MFDYKALDPNEKVPATEPKATLGVADGHVYLKVPTTDFAGRDAKHLHLRMTAWDFVALVNGWSRIIDAQPDLAATFRRFESEGGLRVGRLE